MANSGKADPAIYPKMRNLAFGWRFDLPVGVVNTVLMDRFVSNGSFTVVATATGEASIYLSSGGGYLGGSLTYPAIHDAAIHAIQVANACLLLFQPAETTALPNPAEISFYATTSSGIQRAVAIEANFINKTDPLLILGSAMEEVVTQYRLSQTPKPKSWWQKLRGN